MMRSSKKVLAAILACFTAVGALASCSGADSGTSAPAPAADSASGTSSASPDDAPSGTAPAAAAGGWEGIQPIAEKTAKYKVVTTLYPNQKGFGDMTFFKQLQEKTNVEIEWECLPQEGYNDQKNLMLASNQLPDAFLGYSSLTMDDINKYGPMGMFIPLDDLIAQNSPTYTKRLEENALLNGLSKAFDGKRYSYGTVVESSNRDYPDNLYINKVWLDNLGLAVPTTLDEYYDVLKAFKEQDPNKNSKADEIPYTFTKYNHITGYGSFFGAYGRVDVHNGSQVTALDHFVVENDKVVFTADKPEYKAAIEGLGRFFKDGLFDQEGLVQEQSQYKAKMMNPEAIVGSFYAWDSTSVDLKNAPQYIAIKPLKATADAQDPHVKKRRNHISVQGTGLTITAQAKNPEILAKWVDLFYDYDVGIHTYIGPDDLVAKGGGAYEYNKVDSPDGTGYLARIQQDAPFDNAPNYLTEGDVFGNLLPYNQSDLEKMDNIKNFYSVLPNDLTLPSINFTGDEVKINTSVGMDIQNYVKEMQSKWLLGERDITADWDTYLGQLKSYKLDDYVNMMQGAYDRSTGK